jgi:hypothetical protein
MIPERQKHDILSLANVVLKRYRVVGRFSSTGHMREVPLSSSLPQDTGYCRRSYPSDFLFVEGVDRMGRRKRIRCGSYSSELADSLSTLIETMKAE